MADEAKSAAGEYVALVVIEDIKTAKQTQPGEKIKLTEEQAKVLLAKNAIKAK